MKRGACGCTNHLGKPKIKYPSEDAALNAIFSRHIQHGPHRSYQCPNMEDVWHVASIIRDTPSNLPAPPTVR